MTLQNGEFLYGAIHSLLDDLYQKEKRYVELFVLQNCYRSASHLLCL